jgi:uncharacterized protein YjiS (DUF1127 family)
MARRAIDDAGRLAETWAATCVTTWAALRRTLALWRQRARTRAELRQIPDHLLSDLPIDTSTLLIDRSKPFWRA